MEHAGLLKGTTRGHFQITDRGQNVLREKPEKIDDRYLTRFTGFMEFIGIKKKQKTKEKVNYAKAIHDSMFG